MFTMCMGTNMIIGVLEVKLYAPWVHSLKEKRMIVKSLLAKVQNKFNVSAAEIALQDTHQSIKIGVACLVADRSQADSVMDHVLSYMEKVSEAEIIEVIRDFR